jgi:hypothetical protein
MVYKVLRLSRVEKFLCEGDVKLSLARRIETESLQEKMNLATKPAAAPAEIPPSISK